MREPRVEIKLAREIGHAELSNLIGGIVEPTNEHLFPLLKIVEELPAIDGLKDEISELESDLDELRDFISRWLLRRNSRLTGESGQRS